MATLTRKPQLSPPVTISYQTLVNDPLSLKPSIEEAFGSSPSSLGIVIIKDLPEAYPVLRERLLKLAYGFASLDESVKEKYVDPKSRYSYGWSHGKEIMNGKPDTLKGSYYANPVLDSPQVTEEQRRQHPESYGNNIWPADSDIKGFENAFKALGGFVFNVGLQLATACQPFAAVHLRDNTLSLPSLISSSQTTKARLLHYFPPSPENPLPADDEPIDSWCGFHKDHSLLTGLCSALFLDHAGVSPGMEPRVVSSPSPASGLYIRTRGGELAHVKIPADCLAFQTGEALEVATDGQLRATPHCVRVGAAPGAETISRETFALFMQPDNEAKIGANETFGEFSKRIFDEHYENERM